MKNKMLAWIILFCFVFTIVFNMRDVKEAEAVVLADDLTVAIMVCLIAGGYVVTTNDDVQASAQAFWNVASAECKQKIQDGMISGQMMLGNCWNEVINFVNNAFTSGSIEVDYQYTATEDYVVVTSGTAQSTPKEVGITRYQNFEIELDMGDNLSAINLYGYPGLKYRNDGMDEGIWSDIVSLRPSGLTIGKEGTALIIEGVWPLKLIIYREAGSSSVYVKDAMDGTIYGTVGLRGDKSISELKAVAAAKGGYTCTTNYHVLGRYASTLTHGINYEYVDVASNPYWDLENSPPIVPPWIPSDTVGKTATDLSYTNVNNPPNVDTGAETEVGWLTNVYNLLKGLPAQISSKIGALFVPTLTWADVWGPIRAKMDTKFPSPVAPYFVDMFIDGTPPKWYITNFITSEQNLLIDWANYESLVGNIKSWCGAIMMILTCVFIVRTFRPQQTVD